MRIHNTEKAKIIIKSYQQEGNMGFAGKPIGLWYGIDHAWRDWCKSEMPNWIFKNNFKVILDLSNILFIKNYLELQEFSSTFTILAQGLLGYKIIDWLAISKKYYGIEINPYLWKGRSEYTWYYGWDVASGCVWNKKAIKKIIKIKLNRRGR